MRISQSPPLPWSFITRCLFRFKFKTLRTWESSFWVHAVLSGALVLRGGSPCTQREVSSPAARYLLYGLLVKSKLMRLHHLIFLSSCSWPWHRSAPARFRDVQQSGSKSSSRAWGKDTNVDELDVDWTVKLVNRCVVASALADFLHIIKGRGKIFFFQSLLWLDISYFSF